MGRLTVKDTDHSSKESEQWIHQVNTSTQLLTDMLAEQFRKLLAEVLLSPSGQNVLNAALMSVVGGKTQSVKTFV